VAAITAKRVRDPGKNVGRASVLGTLASAAPVDNPPLEPAPGTDR
jgi:hypothetical protein